MGIFSLTTANVGEAGLALKSFPCAEELIVTNKDGVVSFADASPTSISHPTLTRLTAQSPLAPRAPFSRCRIIKPKGETNSMY